MPLVHIPPLMQPLTGDQKSVSVEGATVRQVINNLEALFPGIKEHLVEGDRIRPNISLAIDGEISRMGLLDRVEESSEVFFLPAVAGGSGQIFLGSNSLP